MRFHVLGPLEIETDDGERHTIGSANQRVLLAMLLANRGGIVANEELIDALWGASPPPSALPTLRAYVSRLRKLVGDRIVRHDDGYSLRCSDAELDAAAFEDDVLHERPTAALARWRGRPYGDAADHPRVEADATRLEALARIARAGRLVEFVALGRLAEAVAAAEAVVLDDPVDETAWAALVRALARSGRVADALRAYQRAGEALADAGLTPGTDLRAAEAEALVEEPVAPGPRRQTPPAPLTTSIGRDEDVDRLLELTTTRRLVTVIGPGGVGKSRLVLDVGRAAAERHALGTRVVELSRIDEAAAIEPSIRRALDLGEHETGLADGLGGVDALLVLDNCEHVVDTVADLLPRILGGGDRLRVLATSREPLRVAGEQRSPLAPLDTRDNSSAIALLVDRARDVGADVDPADPAAGIVVTRLDGLPLAIEMAAARLGTMSLGELAADLDANIAELRTASRGVAERHTTLRAVLAWSEALLTPTEQRVSADFSIFAGPVETTDLVAVVDADDPAATVAALADRSLVTVEVSPDAPTRFGSLATVRRFGRERLASSGRLPAVGERHARWFTEVAEAAALVYETDRQIEAVRRIDAVFDELRAAHRWGREHNHQLAERLSSALFQPALHGLRLEIFDWMRALADVTAPDSPGAAPLFGAVSAGLTLRGHTGEAVEWAARSIAMADDEADARIAVGTLADTSLYDGDLEASLAHARRHHDLAMRHGSRSEQAYGNANVALALAYLGRHDEAVAALIDDDPTSPPTARAWESYTRGEVLLEVDPDEALVALDTAVTLAESVGAHFVSGVAQVSAASSRARAGSPEEAIGPLSDTIERFADRGDAIHLLTTLRNLPTLFCRREQWEPAAELLGALSVIDLSPTFGDEAERLAIAAAATRDGLDPETYDIADALGRSRDLEAAARTALEALAWRVD
ncbi:MAG: SARP family transcriptional regulator [Acidimicrobiales bacterium]|nr:MAG: SARP family transcriptional regulator [Acidimicrobiales bacterium]